MTRAHEVRGGARVIVVALVTVLALAGCGGGEEEAEPTAAVTGPVTVTSAFAPDETTTAETEPVTTTTPKKKKKRKPAPPPVGPPGAGFSARVDAPPTVQAVGFSYYVRVITRTRSGPMPNLCLDFEDDNDSWKILVPGLDAYDDDVFCFGYLRPRVKRKVFLAEIIPANPGQHTMEIGIGNGEIFPELNDVILDADALYWSESFVIAG